MDKYAPSLVVIGASAGGVEALKEVAAGLPSDLAAAVVVVLHLPPHAESRLAHILTRVGTLPASQAEDGEPLCAGKVLVAPPDRHLLVEDEHVRLTRGPRENGVRPSVDVLFRSAALAYGPRTVAVVLSGARDDGAVGARAVDQRGGTVLVQDPRDAVFAGMPESTLALDHPDRVLPLAEIAPAIVGALDPLPNGDAVRDTTHDEMTLETEFASLDPAALQRDNPGGEPSPFSCPACGGVLWEVEDGDALRFRCRVGHAYTADGVLDAEGNELERALWTALRALQERAHLSERIAGRMRNSGSERSASRFGNLAQEAREEADVIRRVLAGRDVPSG